MNTNDQAQTNGPTPITFEAFLRRYCAMLRNPSGEEWVKDKLVDEIAKVGKMLDESPMYESVTETKPVRAQLYDSHSK